MMDYGDFYRTYPAFPKTHRCALTNTDIDCKDFKELFNFCDNQMKATRQRLYALMEAGDESAEKELRGLIEVSAVVWILGQRSQDTDKVFAATKDHFLMMKWPDRHGRQIATSKEQGHEG